MKNQMTTLTISLFEWDKSVPLPLSFFIFLDFTWAFKNASVKLPLFFLFFAFFLFMTGPPLIRRTIWVLTFSDTFPQTESWPCKPARWYLKLVMPPPPIFLWQYRHTMVLLRPFMLSQCAHAGSRGSICTIYIKARYCYQRKGNIKILRKLIYQ